MKASILDLETWFLKVFKHILNLPKYKQSAFCQRINQLHKIMIYVFNHVKHICPNSLKRKEEREVSESKRLDGM